MAEQKEDLLLNCCESNREPECNCSAAGVKEQNAPAWDFHWQDGFVETAFGSISRITTTLERQDLLGGWKVRWGIGRMDYSIPPGIYAVGSPGAHSPVLVSANYKLTFDSLRRELTGLNLWLIILDTNGINVWCAAGKGTFGTEELVRRIEMAGLKDLVAHRQIILPQLAAPGVAAHTVLKETGFRVIYGPVRARDIPLFLQQGCKVTPAMRQVHFGLRERLQVVPVEFVLTAKPIFYIFAAMLVINIFSLLLSGTISAPLGLLGQTLADMVPMLGAILVGTVLVPLLLPYIPGRAFAWKGGLLGVLWALAYVLLLTTQPGWMPTAAYLLLLPAISSFLGMNFTGAATYTSLSGVIKEMTVALPLIAIAAGLGACLLIVGRLV